MSPRLAGSFWCRRHHIVYCARCMEDPRATWEHLEDRLDVVITTGLDFTYQTPLPDCPMCLHPVNHHGCGKTWYGWHCAILGMPHMEIKDPRRKEDPDADT